MAGPYATATGKSPVKDRAVELLRGGASVYAVAAATGVATTIVKRWARAAGIAVPVITMDDRQRMQEHRDRTYAARKAHGMGVTAPIVSARVRTQEKP